MACSLTSRRALLQIGTLGALPFVAGASPAGDPVARRPIRSCTLVFHYGGPSQLETWDPRLAAPVDVRGPFDPIAPARRESPSANLCRAWPGRCPG